MKILSSLGREDYAKCIKVSLNCKTGISKRSNFFQPTDDSILQTRVKRGGLRNRTQKGEGNFVNLGMISRKNKKMALRNSASALKKSYLARNCESYDVWL
jgi:hypothetical protein